MTKLVRKLKQMAKKRSHRKAVQKRKVERAQRELEKASESKNDQLEAEVDREIARLEGSDEEHDDAVTAKKNQDVAEKAVQRAVRIVGDLVLDAPVRKNKKSLSRKQAKRQERKVERGTAITDALEKKWDHKKRRVKIRAQARNENLQN